MMCDHSYRFGPLEQWGAEFGFRSGRAYIVLSLGWADLPSSEMYQVQVEVFSVV
jgi:hypothetical protein